MQWEETKHSNKTGYCVQNGKASKCTFIYIRHTKAALESTQTPKRQEKST